MRETLPPSGPPLSARARVSPPTQNQALAAILFLYRHVLQRELQWMEGIPRAAKRPRLPVVLTRGEVASVLDRMDGAPRLMAALLYGAGLRVLECAWQ